MRSTMMDVPLSVSLVLRDAALYHGDTEIVSHSVEGPIQRTTYSDTWRRSQRLANCLTERGLGFGDCVETLAWNGYRHVEIYYGAAGAGFVCHTINPQLFPEQSAFIINHAADRIIDRTKDVIKSGGEWISSIDLENIALSNLAVREAAVAAKPDERCGKRPLLIVVLRDDTELSERVLLNHYTGKVARWCAPDAVIFAESYLTRQRANPSKPEYASSIALLGRHELPSCPITPLSLSTSGEYHGKTGYCR